MVRSLKRGSERDTKCLCWEERDGEKERERGMERVRYDNDREGKKYIPTPLSYGIPFISWLENNQQPIIIAGTRINYMNDYLKYPIVAFSKILKMFAGVTPID